MKVRSRSELQDQLDKDISWRKKEITTVGFCISGARRHKKGLYFKSGLALLYAHWEGFVKHAARCYLELVKSGGHNYSQLCNSFLFFAVNRELSGQVKLTNVNTYEQVASVFDNPSCLNFNVDVSKFIETREHQNLDSKEFRRLLKKLGLDYYSSYELKEQFLDTKILSVRNKIVHGDRSGEEILDEIESLEDGFKERQEKMLELLDTFRAQIIDAAERKLFLAGQGK